MNRELQGAGVGLRWCSAGMRQRLAAPQHGCCSQPGGQGSERSGSSGQRAAGVPRRGRRHLPPLQQWSAYKRCRASMQPGSSARQATLDAGRGSSAFSDGAAAHNRAAVEARPLTSDRVPACALATLTLCSAPHCLQGEADAAVDHLWTAKKAEIGQ